MRGLLVATLVAVLGSMPGAASAEICRILPPRPWARPVLTRADLRELAADSRSSLPGCIAYDDLRSATLVIRVEEDRSVTVTARTRPSRDELAEACLAGNARDRIVRMIEPYDVTRPLTARLHIDRDD